MRKLISLTETYPYILEKDRDDDTPMTFHVKPLRYEQSHKYIGKAVFKPADGEATISDEPEQKLRLFIDSISKIEYVCWPESDRGITIESETDKKKLYTLLFPDEALEILAAIQNLSTLTKAEIKN